MNGGILGALAAMAFTAVAGSRSYTLTLLGTDTLGTVELKPGAYRLDVGERTAVIHYEGRTGEVPVKVESSDAKYRETTVRVEVRDGVRRIAEIHLGGTRTRLLVGENPAAGAQQ